MPTDDSSKTSTRQDGLGAKPVLVDMNKGTGATPLTSAISPFASAGVTPTSHPRSGTPPASSTTPKK
jgi:hypothetical protein